MFRVVCGTFFPSAPHFPSTQLNIRQKTLGNNKNRKLLIFVSSLHSALDPSELVGRLCGPHHRCVIPDNPPPQPSTRNKVVISFPSNEYSTAGSRQSSVPPPPSPGWWGGRKFISKNERMKKNKKCTLRELCYCCWREGWILVRLSSNQWPSLIRRSSRCAEEGGEREGGDPPGCWNIGRVQLIHLLVKKS